MSSDFLIRVRRERSNVTPTDLEFGECKFTDLDDRLHIGKHNGTAASFSADDPANPPAQQVTYTPVVPRVLELNNVAIPTAGQVYQLSAVPSDRPVIAVVHLNPGFAANSFLRVLCEPVATGSQSQITGVSSWAYLADAVAFFSAAYVSQNRPTLLIPCQAGQLYMIREGSYSSVNDQTQLWTLGYWEGVELNL